MSKPSGRVVDAARRVAFQALQDVTLDDAYANLALPDRLAEAGLVGRDAAFATELVYGTCRWLGTYDAIIETAASRELASLEAGVIDVLRLLTHQALQMRVPVHAAVDAMVDLAALVVGQRTRGVVNAIGRKIANRTWEAWLAALTLDADPDQRLALRYGHPVWIVAALREALGPAVDELPAALDANNVAPLTSYVVRPGLLERASLVEQIAGEPTRFSPFGATAPGNPNDVHAVRSGRAGVQDEGSQLVAWALTKPDTPEGPWLDLCAGPGGKSALLRGLAGGTAFVAAEIHEHRAALVRKALRRFDGFPAVVVADGRQPPWADETFARVMADVPCSGLGALRRRPEARWRHWPEDVKELLPLQTALLASAIRSAKPGGVLAYVTCSPHLEETLGVLRSVGVTGSDVELLDAPSCLPDVPGCAHPLAPRCVQLWPHRHGTDAMFLALLRRI